MTDHSGHSRTKAELLEEIQQLHFRLQEAEGTLEASANSVRVLHEHQQALEESEVRFRTMFESSQDAIIIMDDEGVCVQANPAAEAVFGLPPEELVGRRTFDFLREDVDAAALWRTFRATGSFHGELPLLRADGQMRFVDSRVVADILPGRHMAVVRDITEPRRAQRAPQQMNDRLQNQAEELEAQAEELRAQAEELRVRTDEVEAANAALRQSEERYRRFFDEDLTGDFIATPDGKVLECNPAFAEIYGFADFEHALGCDISQFNPADWADLMARLRAECKVQGYQSVHRRPDGREIRVVANVVGQFNEAAELAEVQGYLYDDTERKRAEEQQQEVHRRLSLHLDTSPLAVVEWDSDFRITRWAGEAAKVFGWSTAEVLGKRIDELPWVYKEDWPAVKQVMEDMLSGRRPRNVSKNRNVRKDGTVIYCEWYNSAISDASGRLVSVLSQVLDVTERNRAEEALRRSEEKFAKAFRSSPIAIAVTRQSDGQIVEVNEAILRLLRFSRDEVIGHTTLDLGIWVDVNDRAQFIQKLSSAGSVRDLEYRLRTKDGEIVTIRLSAEVLEFSGEACLLSTLVDVTEQKRAEETLRESEERLKRTQEIAHLGSWELDLVNDRLSWSDEVYRVFGLQPQEFKATYEAFLETVHPDDRAAVDAAYSGSLREGRDTYEIEHRIVRKSTGEIRTVHEKCEHLRDASDRIVRSVGMVQDVTERRQAEEALRRSEEQFHRLFEDDLTGNFLSTPEGRILLCNPAFARIFGFSTPQDAAGTSILDLYLDPAEREPLRERLKREGKIERFEVWRKRRDGESIYIVENLVAHFDGHGELCEIKGYIFDDTERKRAEEALRELNATLESKVAQRTGELQHRARQLQKLALELSETEDRERRQLAEVLHDDLQQQLAAAKFHLSLLNSRAKHDPAQLAVVAQVDQMLMEAIQKSRNLSHELSPAVLYHADFTGALNWLAGQVHAKHGLEVKVDAFGEVNVSSEALKTFLYKAAQELLFNVVKHARTNQARIRVRRLRRCVCLSVSDRGRGFDPLELRQTRGFGLLSIRERIELLGGRMKIRSVKGLGTTFHIVVPDGPLLEDRYPPVGAGPRARPTSEAERGAHGGPPLRVLLADDHEIVREGLRSLLSDEHDVQVVGEAANGREAVDQAYRLQPDVVIMDVAMPLINGDDATRQIKMHLPQARVIALSMYEEPDMLEKMRRAGAEGYILKTAPAEELLAAIRGKAHPTATA
jgi:PAS domain S-box-containing protein